MDNNKPLFIDSTKIRIISFLIGIIITVLFYLIIKKSFYFLIDNFIENRKALANYFFNLGIFTLLFDFIFLGGLVKIEKGHLAVLTIFGGRKEGTILYEGYIWLNPIDALIGCEQESGTSKGLLIETAKLSNNLIDVKFKVAFTWNVIDPIKYDNNLKLVNENPLQHRLEQSIRDISVQPSMRYLQSVITRGEDISEEIKSKANERIKNDWGIEVQTVSVSDIRTDNPELLNIYSRFELQIREKMLELIKKKMDLEFSINSIKLLIDAFAGILNNKQILDLIDHLISQFKYFRVDVNMNEDMKSFFESILNKVKDNFTNK